jgi:predicted CXXCH cytochrome family protein
MRILIFLLAGLLALVGGCEKTQPAGATAGTISVAAAPEKLTYAGREACAGCHVQQAELYKGSDHDLAMQAAAPDSVLADFNDTEFIYNGSTTTFSRRDGGYYVTTDGPAGKLETYRIQYTFGVRPLQQYLIEFPGGRLQSLGIAWDTRPQRRGGQHWFHLYPGAHIDYRDPLHWTGINQNWNYMCAECHSTNLRKNFDLNTRSYTTRWSDINVSCEACHGPGSRHIQLAGTLSPTELRDLPSRGLAVDFHTALRGRWTFKDDHPIASLDQPGTAGAYLDVCARCHSRRTPIDSDQVYRKTLHDTHVVALLEQGLYHPDGQINDEVYVYGSFAQSRMYRAGVTCNDCHDPHSLKPRMDGNRLCLGCHRQDFYDTAAHHHHETGSEAAQCVSCHMPAQTYMVIDTRRDHSLRIPRPDLSIEIGAPNACNQCHTEQTPQWALQALQRWYKKPASGFHYGIALHAARTGRAGAEPQLLEVIKDTSLPEIVRASALSYLDAARSPDSLAVVSQGLDAAGPLIRRASLATLGRLDAGERYRMASRLLNDPVKSVRIEAARRLAAMVNTDLPAAQMTLLTRAINEYVEAQQLNADRGYAHVNLGDLYGSMQEPERAEQAYRDAIELEPGFLPAWVNLADLYRTHGREAEAESLLRRALHRNSDGAVLHYSLGLSQVRQKKYADALLSLRQAAQLEPATPRYTLTYAIALNSTGDRQQALAELEDYDNKNPSNREVLLTLATMNRDAGNIDTALGYAQTLLELSPGDEQAKLLTESLESMHR